MLPLELCQDQLRVASTAIAYDLEDSNERAISYKDLRRLYYNLQAAIRPQMFVEIGAHEAQFSRDMRSANPEARILAFEGSPSNFERFSQAFDFNSLGISYVQSLVSDIDGQTEFLVQESINGVPVSEVRGNDSLLVRTEPGVTYSHVSLPSVRLDTYFDMVTPRYSDIGFWIDVEGAFGRVYSGGRSTLSRASSILIEVEEYSFWSGQWTFDLVHASLAELGLVLVARDFETPHQFNAVFVSRSALTLADVRSEIASHLSRIGTRWRNSGG